MLVIGGGQAGLAMGYHLAQRGLRFEIVDAGAEIGHAWRSRWDSLPLFTPAQYDNLPGLAFPVAAGHLPGKDDVADYLQAYAAAFELPVRLNTKVTSLTKRDGGYVAATADEEFAAEPGRGRHRALPGAVRPAGRRRAGRGVHQIHSADYRNPANCPRGRVLVVGAGNSGCQIAQELAATRKVDLAVGKRIPSLPQRLLGKDLFWWLTGVGFMRISTDSRVGRRVSQRDVLIGSSPEGCVVPAWR